MSDPLSTKDTVVTTDGNDIEIRHAAHYRDDTVLVDGIEQRVIEAKLLRDGGTRIYVCEAGTLILPRRIGSTDRTPRWRENDDA